MNTRRKFLQAGSLVMAGHLSENVLLAQQTAGLIQAGSTDPMVQRDYWNDLPNYLISVVNEARKRRKAALSKVVTEQQSTERASFITKKIWELIGGQLERTPLNVTKTGSVERETYRIEKLVFESQPRFYVPAHLYIPKSASGPFPAILSPLGHTPEGKLYRSYQTLFQNLARKGFMVLTWDPPGQGERLQYPEPNSNHSRFGPTGEHDQFGWPAFLIGSTTTQFETWDAVRALDYLLSRSEVDKSRVGCCGHSGGGTATMYLCALEPRIHAAVIVEGHTENVAGAAYEPPGAFADAEQNIVNSLKLGLDRGDLLAPFAPRPLLICFTHMDVGATYSPHYEQGTREIYQELKDLYSIHRATERVRLSASNLPHDYDFFHRRVTYDWFNKWLTGKSGDSTEADFEDSPATVLNCTSRGQILTSSGGRTAYQVNSDRLRSLEAARLSVEGRKDQVRQTLREVLGITSEQRASRGSILSSNTRRDLAIEEFEFHSEPTVRVPGWFLKPSSKQAKLRVAVVLSSSGKNRLFDDLDLLAAVNKLNIALCAIDTRGSGQATPRLPSSGPLFYGRAIEMAYSLVSLTAGVPLMGQRVSDLLKCLDYLHTRPDVDSSRIGLFGTQASGLEAAFGAALDERFRAVLLQQTLMDYASVVKSPDYSLKVASIPFGLLKHFDLPQVVETIAPRPVWLLHPVGANGNALTSGEVRTRFGPSTKIFALAEPREKVFQDWVNATLS